MQFTSGGQKFDEWRDLLFPCRQEGETNDKCRHENFGGLGSSLTNPISRGRRPRSDTPNPL